MIIDTYSGIEYYRWLSIKSRLKMRLETGLKFRASEMKWMRENLCIRERTAVKLLPIAEEVVQLYAENCCEDVGPHCHMELRDAYN